MQMRPSEEYVEASGKLRSSGVAFIINTHLILLLIRRRGRVHRANAIIPIGDLCNLQDLPCGRSPRGEILLHPETAAGIRARYRLSVAG